MNLFRNILRNLAPATCKDDGPKDLADFVSIMASTAFKLANCRLCISLLFSASLGKSSVEPQRPKARVLALTGVLPSLVGDKGEEIRDLYCDGRFEGRFVSPALAGAAQLRASGDSSCWYIVQ
jgi:hypothetical protein